MIWVIPLTIIMLAIALLRYYRGKRRPQGQ